MKYLKNKWRSIKYFFKSLFFLQAFFSPFKRPKLQFYAGPIKIGVPYFLPRKASKFTREFKSIKWFGFNYCSLGYKTKWTPTDYRHEWNPVFSFVFMGLQFCMSVVPKGRDWAYWESFLYYYFDTDKKLSKYERIFLCRKNAPQTWIESPKEGERKTVDYYTLFLKKKYLKTPKFMRKVDRKDLLNGWLKYHNTNVDEVIAKHPKEVLEHSDWFKLYPVTQEQSDEWEKWAKEHIKKVTKLPKKSIDRGWGMVYLDCTPNVIEDPKKL